MAPAANRTVAARISRFIELLDLRQRAQRARVERVFPYDIDLIW
jgi:hypothetical protein